MCNIGYKPIVRATQTIYQLFINHQPKSNNLRNYKYDLYAFMTRR